MSQIGKAPARTPGNISTVLEAVTIQDNNDDDGLVLQPIETGPPDAIVVQPSRTERLPRRPIPINTIDWVSTSQSQLNVYLGLYFLTEVEQVELQQIVDLDTALGITNNASQYRVRVPRAETLFLTVEESSRYQRLLLGSSRDLTLNVLDHSGQTAFIIRKSLGWGCTPGFLHKVVVETTVEKLGSVEQDFTVLGISFAVYDSTREPLCYIRGPNVYRCCMSNDTQFQVVSTDESRQVASLIHQWDCLLGDYKLLLTFPMNTNIKLKGLLLGAAFLMQFLYFERR